MAATLCTFGEEARFWWSGALRPPGERSSGPGRQRADGWRRGAVPVVVRAAPARRVWRRVRAAGGSEPSAGARKRAGCAGPAAAAARARWRRRSSRATTWTWRTYGRAPRRRVVPAADADQLESEGYPTQRADPCIQSDSSGWRAPAVDDTESVEDHFIELRPAGPASVHSRCAPRGTSPRRRGDGPQGQARSYAGAAQCPCAGRIGGSPRAEPNTVPSSSAGPRGPESTCLAWWL